MNTHTTRYIFLLLLCFLLPLGLYAQTQDKVKLKGRVIDEDEEPIPMVMVHIQGQTAMATAGLDGRYLIEFATDDSVVVEYNAFGYEKRTKVLRNPKGELTLNITMKEKGREMEELTVREYRRQMGTTQEIDPSGVKHLPSTTGNAVEELVATQAGVSVHNELSSQYNVRGGSFDENCVYINGVEVYRPLLISSGQQEGLSVINSDMVEKINFSSGGFEAKYGDRMSSVLDITYRRPAKAEASVQMSILGANVYAGVGNKKFSFSNGFRYKTNQYMLGSLQTKGEYDPRFFDYQGYLSWTPSRKWTVDMIGYIARNDYRFKPSDRETNFGTMEDVKSFKVYFDGKEQDLFRTLFGTLRIKHQFNDKSSLSLLGSAFTTRERETYDIQGQYWLQETNTGDQLGVGTYMEHARNLLSSRTQTLRLAYNFQNNRHRAEAGFALKHESVRENTREWEYRDSSGYSMPHTEDALRIIYNLKSVEEISSTSLELYAQNTQRIIGKAGIFNINYGARLSQWSWNHEWLFSPRASVGWIPAKCEDLTLRLATGIYYQRPFYKELRDTTTTDGNTIVTLNRGIRSQRSFQVVLGGDYRFRLANRPFKFSTEVYYKAQSRMNPYNVDNVKIVYYGYNCASGHVAGVDFKLYGEFVPGTDSWISLSLMSAKMTLNGKTIPQPTSQRYNISFFFSDYFPHTTRWKLTLKACVADGLPFGPPHTGLEKQVFRAPAYKRVDIGMNYRLLDNEDRHITHGAGKIFRNIWLGIDCFNVFGINNVSSYYWVTDVTNHQYAVPNYLTGRLLNARILMEF